MKLAPIILFAFKRPRELAKVVNALQNNSLISSSELYIFIDGPRNALDLPKVQEVRNICDNISGFKKIHRIYHENNQGCANSIISGISQVFKEHEAAIILEDDILISTNFLAYMNQCLTSFKNSNCIFSISGFSLPFQTPKEYHKDIYCFPRTCSWGWGTWRSRWESVDWDISDYESFMSDPYAKKRFKEGGSDVVKMLRDYKKGYIDAWDIRFCYSQFKQNGLTIYPVYSKAENIGFGSVDATHTNVYNRFKTKLDASNKNEFNLDIELTVNKVFAQQFLATNSILARGIGKLKTMVQKMKLIFL